jgi:formylglycine-generating enzyme required for sulfatase activity
MGSPEDEPGRRPDQEARHLVKIPRAFALAAQPVTVEQFGRFLDDRKLRSRLFPAAGQAEAVLKRFSPDSGCPVVTVDWYTAAQYCNWLSEQEGIPEDQWAYPTDPSQIRPGMAMPAGYLRRTGYRLATEAEWECACRAGATTSRCYGRGERLLGKYAWYQKTALDHTRPVGLLKPNDWGLFDMHGNAWQWCQDRLSPYPQASDGESAEDQEDKDQTDAKSRVSRGGAFLDLAADVRCAHHIFLVSAIRGLSAGFRVARTYR